MFGPAMVRGGMSGETVAATKGFIGLRARQFQTPGENVRLCERWRIGGGMRSRGWSGSDQYANFAGWDTGGGLWVADGTRSVTATTGAYDRIKKSLRPCGRRLALSG